MKKILYISGTRADYGLMLSTLKMIDRHPELELEIAATGMHLMPEFGHTLKDMRRDGFKIHELSAIYKKDDKESMATFIGDFIHVLAKKVSEINPDIILVLGDRGEMLAGAIVGAYLAIPVAHIDGGDVTSTVDEFTRHAITKLACIHFPTTELNKRRLIKMGEERWRIHVVGAPGIDSILNEKPLTKKEICRKLGLDAKKPIFLVIQHPVTLEVEEARRQMQETMQAVVDAEQQTVVLYPNADVGGRGMIQVIEQYRKYPFIRIHKSLPHEEYISLMRYSEVMIGNSSSGIVESPSLGLPAINVGGRQGKRQRAKNIMDVGYSRAEIKRAIKKAVLLKGENRKYKNPYGDGKTGKRIVNILAKIRIDKRLLDKKLSY
jgi:GDP/UDP-N,N'-diacetylbacillosamine 2-epimerase (hydrolysing)